MIPPVPGPCPTCGGRPLDPARPAPDDLPLGLRAQIGATKEALLGLARAHVDLARTEASEIGREVGRAAALAGVAAACLLLLALLLPIGLLLFLGEALFGSIGWGLVHGTMLLVAVAVLAVLIALRVPGLGLAVAGALVVGLVVAVLLALSLPNALWVRLGDGLAPGVAPDARPLVVGLAAGALAGGVIGLLSGLRSGGRAPVTGLVGGAVLGLLLGAISAITFDARVGIALGVTAWLLAWPILMGVQAFRHGIDQDELKRRFTPQVTIDTTKETIEWAKARMPLGPQS